MYKVFFYVDKIAIKHYCNIRTLSENIKFVSILCETEQKTRDSVFFLFLKLVQINYIFSDNVGLLSIYPTFSISDEGK